MMTAIVFRGGGVVRGGVKGQGQDTRPISRFEQPYADYQPFVTILVFDTQLPCSVITTA